MNFSYHRKMMRWYLNGKPMPYGVRPSQHLRDRDAEFRKFLDGLRYGGRPFKPLDLRHILTTI